MSLPPKKAAIEEAVDGMLEQEEGWSSSWTPRWMEGPTRHEVSYWEGELHNYTTETGT